MTPEGNSQLGENCPNSKAAEKLGRDLLVLAVRFERKLLPTTLQVTRGQILALSRGCVRKGSSSYLGIALNDRHALERVIRARLCQLVRFRCPAICNRNVQRFRGGLAFKAHRLCVSLNSRLESNKEEEEG